MRCVLPVTLLAVLSLASLSCSHPSRQALAQEAFARALAERQARKESASQYYKKGLRAFQESDLDEAQKLLETAVAADDRHAPAWMLLGHIAFQRDHLYEAAQAFHMAARADPNRYEHHYNAATVLEASGKYAQAVEGYEVALRLAPGQLEVMENLARCLIRQGSNPKRARELINTALTSERRPEWRIWLKSQQLRLAGQGERSITPHDCPR